MFFNTFMNAINLKPDLLDVDTQFDNIITKSLNYDTKYESNKKH